MRAPYSLPSDGPGRAATSSVDRGVTQRPGNRGEGATVGIEGVARRGRAWLWRFDEIHGFRCGYGHWTSRPARRQDTCAAHGPARRVKGVGRHTPLHAHDTFWRSPRIIHRSSFPDSASHLMTEPLV